jgi:hypothetical protein
MSTTLLIFAMFLKFIIGLQIFFFSATRNDENILYKNLQCERFEVIFLIYKKLLKIKSTL